MKPPTTSITVVLGFGLLAASGCSKIRDELEQREYRRKARIYQQFLDFMEQARNDRIGIYRLEYRLPANVLASVMNDPGNFRALPDGRFDIMPWFQNAGVVPNDRSSFVIDSRESTLTAIDNGPNIALSENLLRPLHPLGYEQISP